jgi:hypothetical protein
MHEQDLQSGNLAGAQSDFAAFLHNISAGTQSNCANTVLTSGNSTVAQALAALGNDLQSGNLQGAHEDSTNLQQELTQISSRQVRGHHGYHRHQAESSQSSSPSSPQTNPIDQAFNTLAQDLQRGILSWAQSTFSALQNDLHEISGFLTAGSAEPPARQCHRASAT